MWRGALLVLASCGRVGFAVLGGDGGGVGGEGGEVGDGGVPHCASWGAFSPPQLLPPVLQSPDDDWTATPTLDGLELFFFSFRNASNGDLFHSTRATTSDAWSPPAPISELTTPAREADPTIAGDRLELLFTRFEADFLIYRATRATPSSGFAPAIVVAELDTTGGETSPFLSPDGLRLVFTTTRFGSLTIVESTRPDRGAPFAPAVTIIPTSGFDDDDPTISTDGLELFFSSSRPGGLGGRDIYTAQRPAVDQPFGAPELVTELSSAGDETGVRLSSDGTTIYFGYNTVSAGGFNADMSSATRACR